MASSVSSLSISSIIMISLIFASNKILDILFLTVSIGSDSAGLVIAIARDSRLSMMPCMSGISFAALAIAFAE